jgi:hypothetical protein
MFEVSLYCIKPDGGIPQIGDNDSGRFLKFSDTPVLEHKYLLSLAAVYFRDAGFKLRQFDLNEETFWVFGESAKTVWDTLPVRGDSLGSKSFPEAGWYIIRHENDYCFISCGPNGGDGWHSHNDKLSFELMLDGKDIIVDPGTYVYTANPDERNKFRSTEYHNTIKFEGYEQNEFPENGIFSLPDGVKINKADLSESDDKIAFHGEVRYSDITHSRAVTLDRKSCEWNITDSFSYANPINAKLIFHLPPSLTSDGSNILTKEKRKKITSIEVKGFELTKSKYYYSPEYGVKVKAECLIVNVFANKEISFINTYLNRL